MPEEEEDEEGADCAALTLALPVDITRAAMTTVGTRGIDGQSSKESTNARRVNPHDEPWFCHEAARRPTTDSGRRRESL